ncbi:MAG: Trk system potassium transporter TrkA [Planctomycetia bacterium]|nr:Trk system potassium transporter TrkA [Planctomycetia bacterium]
MQVLILGGGTVGSSIAQRLSKSHHVTVVESNPARKSTLDTEVDARVIIGNATDGATLFQAGASSADVCLALTGSDEANLVGASIAKAMGAKRTAARIFAPWYRETLAFDYRRQFKIDRLLSLEYMTAMELACHVHEPGAALIENFASGELEMQDVVITRASDMLGKALCELQLPPEVRVAAIQRGESVWIASAQDKLELEDHVTLVGAREQVESLKKRLITHMGSRRNVVIVGGGETGLNLALVLQRRDHKINLIERSQERCEYLAQRLTKKGAQVIAGNGRSSRLLDEYGVGSDTTFVACTGNDEFNIISCVEAMSLGVTNVLAVVNRPDYATVIDRLGITEVVNPYEIMGRQVEGFMHRGALLFQNSTLLGGSLEVIELTALPGSPITETSLRDLRTPKPTLFAAVIRENRVLIPNAKFVARPNDVMVALTTSNKIAETVALFEPTLR